MALRILETLLLTCALLTACTLPAATPTTLPSEMPATPTFTLIPSLTPISSTATSTPFSLPAPQPGTVAYDFVAHMCEATWANSRQHLPTCPGNLTDIGPGYFDLLSRPAIEGQIISEVPAIVMLPQQTGTYTGIFGIYPYITILAGDRFRAALACQGDANCGVEFSLEYYDANGSYHDHLASWNHHYGGGLFFADVDLSQLAGKSVKLVLAVRDIDGDPAADYTLWLMPYIYRP